MSNVFTAADTQAKLRILKREGSLVVGTYVNGAGRRSLNRRLRQLTSELIAGTYTVRRRKVDNLRTEVTLELRSKADPPGERKLPGHWKKSTG